MAWFKAIWFCVFCGLAVQMCGAASDGGPSEQVTRIAVVLDDSGNRPDLMAKLIAARLKVTFSILPRLEKSLESDRMARDAGWEIMLHLPMEPLAKNWVLDPSCSIQCGMDSFRIAGSLCEALRSVPDARGVNNHMGSRATQDAPLMGRLMAELRRSGLFFLDSQSSNDSIAAETARREGIRVATRRVFLDNVDEERAIAAQLAALTRSGDGAVGIGHLRPKTVETLLNQMPLLAERGIEWVFCSEVVK